MLRSQVRIPAAGPGRSTSAGFSLVEVLIVVVILGILGSVVVFAVQGITGRGQTSACSADAATLKVAEEAALANGAAYLTVAGLQAGGWLRTTPQHHDVQLAAGSYTIVADATCGGTGATSGPTTTTTPADAPAITTTTVAAATTTTVLSNGVSAQAAVAGGTNPYWGEGDLALTNTKPITALTVTVVVAKTPGVAYASQWTNFPGNKVTGTTTSDSASVRYKWTLGSGAIPSGSYTLGAAYNGNGTPRVTSGDSWTVVSTSGGVTTTLTGSF
jgi:prepilin-type N-terminal cleavage/methylation domain-containing protein